ncbi:putative membrane protein [uncultured Stenotrophomonas sp.]|uniref:Putative membrane protein n=1 Tax=uncultured Stenotrophomonas sp. TaxID=165438 RepID=A0A1Y5Q5U2_9GAMM|nr:putative membrane protein [uncultured Stenotrophomonas sp.]
MSIRSMSMGLLVAASLLCMAPSTAAAQEDEGISVEQFLQSLQFRSGAIEVSQAKARFNLDADFRYLDQTDARRVLEDMWGNPPDESVLGMIVPRSPGLADDGSWAVVVTYADDGYVSDEDASKIDYSKLLREMQEQTREANPEREKAGYGTLQLVGWAVPPRYDGASNKLYWAKELEFNGHPDHSLNYDIRVLGRHGYLSLNAISGMAELAQVREGMEKLLPMAEFEQGARYADHNPKTDKVAAYGVATLIGGGLAAKAGLFAKLGLLLAKFWKLLLIGVVVLGGAARKLFGGDRGNRTVR